MKLRYDFASDNTAPATPEVMEALARCNQGFEPAYGKDSVSYRAGEAIRALLDVEADVWFAASGTAANSLALTCLANPHEAVVCHRDSHIATDETGAPAMYGAGLGLIGLAGDHGRIDPDALIAAIGRPDSAHAQAPAALSLTNATEYGAVYDLDLLKALIEPARSKGYGVHLDGARVANAAAAGLDLKAMVMLGIDVLVLGGTKAGATPTEAIVVINPALRRRFDARLKHYGQLVSKHRYLAAPWLGLLSGEGTGGVWIERSRHANAMARHLAEASGVVLRHPVQANGVFADMSAAMLKAVTRKGWVIYRLSDGSVRMMCNWATTIDAVEELAADIRAAS